MKISVEAQNIELSPEWKDKIQERLEDLSDSRDPVISARATCSFRQGQQPPADVNLVVKMRGKNIVIKKSAEHVDAALHKVLDTFKREIRSFYDQRAEHHGRTRDEELEAAVPPLAAEDPLLQLALLDEIDGVDEVDEIDEVDEVAKNDAIEDVDEV